MNLFNHNHFNKNIKIDKTNHIQNRKSLGFGDDKFNFDDALKSIDIPYLEFVNFFINNKEALFKFTKKEYKKLLFGNVNLDEEYEMKIVNVEYGFNEFKIQTIWEKTQEKKIEVLPIIYKLKCLGNENLQFYVTSENNCFKVCFIDIYHLGIPTKMQDTKTIYNKHKGKKYGLDKLKS